MSTTPNTQLATTKEDRLVTYRAFGSDAEVKLSIGIVRSYLCKPTRQGVQASEADCMNFMMMCKARALNPFERDCFLVGYDGRNGAEFSIITAISAFLKRAEASAEFDGLESGVIVKDKDGAIVDRVGDFTLDGDEILGGWAKVHKKNIRIPIVARLNLRARYKDNQFWNNDKAGMIVKCAESDALRTAFPTKLGGLYVEPERRDDMRVVTGAASDVQHVAPIPGKPDLGLPPPRMEQEEEQEPPPAGKAEEPPRGYTEEERKALLDEVNELRDKAGFSMADFKKHAVAGGFAKREEMVNNYTAETLVAIREGFERGTFAAAAAAAAQQSA
jgi:phage recombination protein Bet